MAHCKIFVDRPRWVCRRPRVVGEIATDLADLAIDTSIAFQREAACFSRSSLISAVPWNLARAAITRGAELRSLSQLRKMMAKGSASLCETETRPLFLTWSKRQGLRRTRDTERSLAPLCCLCPRTHHSSSNTRHVRPSHGAVKLANAAYVFS